jgi:S-adenosylmethionine decarboxylase
MIVGTEWIIDAAGCDSESLRNMGLLQSLVHRMIIDLNLQTIGQALWHQFPTPGGITGLVLLTESHIACHTYPEFQTATFNLYCCHYRKAWSWDRYLKELLDAREVSIRVVERTVPTFNKAVGNNSNILIGGSI